MKIGIRLTQLEEHRSDLEGTPRLKVVPWLRRHATA